MAIIIGHSIIMGSLLVSVFLSIVALAYFSSISAAPKKACQARICVDYANELRNDMNTNINPCTNFYEYVGGNWRKNHPVSEYRIWHNQATLESDTIKNHLLAIFEPDGIDGENPFVEKTKELYKGCMDFIGDPYSRTKGYYRECQKKSDCPSHLACICFKCIDSCPGNCGKISICSPENYVPRCTCLPGYTGNPFFACESSKDLPEVRDPCSSLPCGPNSQCRTVNGQAVYTCLPDFTGSPPNCRPKCIVNDQCPANLACMMRKCADPCPNKCGINAQCTVKNHNPKCTCPVGFGGDPFTLCTSIRAEDVTPTPLPPSCNPSPCGPNSQCRTVNGQAVCTCLPDFTGSPPNCRPECIVNYECPANLACMMRKCADPCPNQCGINAQCTVKNHNPKCTCPVGFGGDPFTLCTSIRAEDVTPTPLPPSCNPSPCGPNSQCRTVNGQAVCTCLPDFTGSPPNCRPECIVNYECPANLACMMRKCADPCPNQCGINAQCTVKNHNPKCTCPVGFGGDPFTLCTSIRAEDVTPTPLPPSCNPSPCGPNSLCLIDQGTPTCSCLPGSIGVPPDCHPECVVSSECKSHLACVNQKCHDPCVDSCGFNAHCHVLNHKPVCTCMEEYTGDPYTQCIRVMLTTEQGVINPCTPSPCGPNALCQIVQGTAACACLPDYIGVPPGCRPECVTNVDCPSNKACVDARCIDPCPGSCRDYARCRVINHTVTCTCPTGYTGNPFFQCAT